MTSYDDQNQRLQALLQPLPLSATLFPPNATTRNRQHALAYLNKLRETRSRRRLPSGT